MALTDVELVVSTSRRDELLDVTADVQQAVTESGVSSGVCHLFVPHTTAAVTINEGADPDVKQDVLADLDRIVPHDSRFAHAEGNSAAHVKTSLVGTSQTVFIEAGRLKLGTWQSIYFCEFDGPRTRKLLVKVTAG